MVFAPGPGDAASAYAQLDSVPADVLALDLVHSPALAGVVSATGAGKTLALGIVDGHAAATPDAAALAEAVWRMLKRYTFEVVYLQPAGGLRNASGDYAWKALSLLGAVRAMMRGQE